jgi:dTDP-4-amino-4,6-dideoxy-D-galactose acyltransferase
LTICQLLCLFLSEKLIFKMSLTIENLEWDSDFFGFHVARVNSLSNETKDWENILAQLRIQGIKLAYWQVKPDNHYFHEFAKINNGKLVDIKTTFSLLIHDNNFIKNGNIEKYVNSEPNRQLLSLAIQSGTYSRFANDRNISREKFEELYHRWIINSVKKSMADDVLVYKLHEDIIGLVTVYEKNNSGNIGLFGVDESHRGKGIGKTLVDAVKHYFFEKGIQKINVITQGHNQSACKFYECAGFTVSEEYEFYHFWLM